MSLQANEYRCARCGNVYTKERTDEEAVAETQFYWFGVDQQDCAAVRDDCYQQIWPETHPEVYINEEPGEIIRKIIAAYGVPMTCFECGGKTWRFTTRKIAPRRCLSTPTKKCIIGSPNELNWHQGVRVDPGEEEQEGNERIH